MTALVPFSPRRVPTLWCDADAGDLAGILARAWNGGYERVMLTGRNHGPAWLLGDAGEHWTHGAHHLDHETPVGRYITPQGHSVEVRRAAEWFGAGDYSPATAAAAWDDLQGIVADTFGHGAGLLGSPGATGRELWLRSLPREDGRTVAPAQLDPEAAELIRSTSGQHRIELRPAPLGVATMPELHVLDGRLMYAACVRQLGVVDGARRIDATEAAATLADPRGRYARAWLHVTVTVPADWHTVGILPFREDDGTTWTYPAEPGRTFETWADSSEVILALDWGWKVRPLSGLLFTEGRPLDTWAARILRAYDRVNPDQLGTDRAKMCRAGLRWMLLHSVGAWHSTGRSETTVTASPMDRPRGDGWGAPERMGDATVWRRRVDLDGRAALMAHPEWSAQIWGRARARVLQAPTAHKGTYAGALWVDPSSLVSIYGDAVMTTTPPPWSSPDHDDGKPGRLRTKGHLPGPLPWPTRSTTRDQLMHRAEQHTRENDR